MSRRSNKKIGENLDVTRLSQKVGNLFLNPSEQPPESSLVSSKLKKKPIMIFGTPGIERTKEKEKKISFEDWSKKTKHITTQRFRTSANNSHSSPVKSNDEHESKKKITTLKRSILHDRQENPNKKISDSQKIPQDSQSNSIIERDVPVESRYCDNIIDPELNSTLETILSQLRYFETRNLGNTQSNSKQNQRLIFGFREITRKLEFIKLTANTRGRINSVTPNSRYEFVNHHSNEIALVIFTRNITDSPSGINPLMEKLLAACNNEGVPYVFAFTRRKLTKICRVSGGLASVAAIVNYTGVEKQMSSVWPKLAESRKLFDAAKASSLSIHEESKL